MLCALTAQLLALHAPQLARGFSPSGPHGPLIPPFPRRAPLPSAKQDEGLNRSAKLSEGIEAAWEEVAAMREEAAGMGAPIEQLKIEARRKGAELLNWIEATQKGVSPLEELQSKMTEFLGSLELDVTGDRGASQKRIATEENQRLLQLATKVEGMAASKRPVEPIWKESAKKWEQAVAARKRRNRTIFALGVLSATLLISKQSLRRIVMQGIVFLWVKTKGALHMS
ncbi:hypothetical protein AB1Y20_023075 [Prymnesium parvum]|uniref:Uncharacterized protein n=1 Tax=Prymnesium parvum TaxID=97485 RepID=A0AB34JD07_PRYPA